MTNYRDLFKDPMDHLPEIPKLEPSTQDKLLEAGADIGVGLAVNKMAGGGLPGLVLGGIAAYKTDEVARDYLGELKTGQEPPDGTSAQNEAIALGVGIVAGFGELIGCARSRHLGCRGRTRHILQRAMRGCLPDR